MKETNIEWFGQLPDDWDKIKFFQLFEERSTKVSDKDYMPLSVCKAGIVPQLDSAVKTDNGDNRKLVLKGDYVFNTRSDRKGSSGMSSYDGSVSVISLVLKPRRDINKQYFHYLLRSHSFIEEFYRLGHGLVADLWTTRFEDIKNEFLPFPELKKQQKIADFLDDRCSQIDTFVEKKTKEIELLEELKKSVITEAVLGRLDKNRKLKDSGVQWLGMIPEDWETRKFFQIYEERSTKVSDKDYKPLSVCKAGIVPQLDSAVKTDNGDNRKLVLSGDYVFNTRSDRKGSSGFSSLDGSVSVISLVLKPRRNIYGMYYHYLLRSNSFVEEFYRIGHGLVSDLWTTRYEDIKNSFIPIPDIEEQKSIANFLDKKCSEIDTMISNIQKEIDSIKDLRKRLICDAVTGKLAV